MNTDTISSPGEGSGWMLSTLIDREAPALKTSGELVEKLGLCLLFSTTSVAAGIRLDRLLQIDADHREATGPQRFRTSDLGSELDSIATHGLEIFTHANENLHHVRLATKSIGRPRGPLENLHNDIGDPEANQNNKRLLLRVKRELETSFRSFEKIITEFEIWQEQIKALKQAVQNENRMTTERQEDITEQISTKMREAAAKQKEHEKVKADLARIENQFDQKLISNHTPGRSPGLKDRVLTWWYTKAEQPRREKEREYDRRRKEAENCLQQLYHVQASLAKAQQKAPREDQLAKVLQATLTALALIGSQINGVFTQFNELKTQVFRLVDDYVERLDEYGYEAHGITDKRSIKQFRDDMLELRGVVLFVEHLSWMYAGTISQVMVKGLDHVVRNPRLASADANQSLHLINGPSSNMLSIENGNASVTSFESSQIEQSFREGCERFEQWQAASESQERTTPYDPQYRSASSYGAGDARNKLPIVEIYEQLPSKKKGKLRSLLSRHK